MIMATTYVGGSLAIDSIPAGSVGDLDDDGMKEILDGWGRPISFVRWPCGYVGESTGLLDTSIPDDLDPFRADFGYGNSTGKKAWSIRPLIVSAGADGELGVSLDDSSLGITYNTQTWPTNEMGSFGPIADEAQGRTSPYLFPDPFLRHLATTTNKPGTILDTALHADDITNFALEVSQ